MRKFWFSTLLVGACLALDSGLQSQESRFERENGRGGRLLERIIRGSDEEKVQGAAIDESKKQILDRSKRTRWEPMTPSKVRDENSELFTAVKFEVSKILAEKGLSRSQSEDAVAIAIAHLQYFKRRKDVDPDRVIAYATTRLGIVEIRSNPKEAEFHIDSGASGNTNITKWLSTGKREIQFSKAGYKSMTVVRNVKVGANDPIEVTLEPIE